VKSASNTKTRLERFLLFVFLRRYVTYCARRRRYAAMEGAARLCAVAGTYLCSDGDSGSFQIFEMQVNPIAVTGRFTAANNKVAGCQFNGYFGGMRATTF